MKTKWLFPHSYRMIGFLIIIPLVIISIVLSAADTYVSAILHKRENTTYFGVVGIFDMEEVLGIGLIIGLLFIAFSKEKIEDEMISQLRLEALQWSVYANYVILIIAIVTVYDRAFFSVMIYNMFTVLLVFIARFRWLIFRTTIIHARYEKSTEG